MPDALPLRPGDPYRCPRCHLDHVIDQPYADHSTAERTHLYITCRGARYFVGQVIETPRRAPGPTGASPSESSTPSPRIRH